MNSILEAKKFSTYKHRNQKYGDLPYYFHLSQVAHKVENLYYEKSTDAIINDMIMIAWLHDVLEDTDTTFIDIRNKFGLNIAIAVECLSKTPDLSYEQYISKVRSNVLALRVKICDTISNLEKSISDGDNKRIRKYARQLNLLTE